MWGTTYLAIRILVETFPPLLISGGRWIIAGSLLLLILKIRKEPVPAVSSWPALAIVGLLLIGFGNGAVVWAEQTVPSGLTALLLATSPFWMVCIEAAIPGGVSLTRLKVLGLAVGFAGIAALVWPEIHVGESSGLVPGIVATQFACAGWAVGSVYSKRRKTHDNVLAEISLQMLFGGLFLALAGLLHGEAARIVFSERSFLAFLYLIFFGSIVGFSAYVYALKHLPVATVSMYAYINPLIAVVLGVVVLGEAVSGRIIAAAAIVLAGVFLVRRPGGR